MPPGPPVHVRLAPPVVHCLASRAIAHSVAARGALSSCRGADTRPSRGRSWRAIDEPCVAGRGRTRCRAALRKRRAPDTRPTDVEPPVQKELATPMSDSEEEQGMRSGPLGMVRRLGWLTGMKMQTLITRDEDGSTGRHACVSHGLFKRFYDKKALDISRSASRSKCGSSDIIQMVPTKGSVQILVKTVIMAAVAGVCRLRAPRRPGGKKGVISVRVSP